MTFYRTRVFWGILALALPVALSGQEATSSDVQKMRDLKTAIESSEKLLAKYPNNDFAPNLMFQLSELYVKRATLTFQREMLVYEDAERKLDAGLIEKVPDIPYLDLGKAIDLSEQIIARFPAVPFRDKVIYRIALYYAEQGDKAKATEYYIMLTQETADPDLLEECYFRLGEYYFDQKDYPSTIKYYSQVLESWDNPFFDMALYKLGWSYYNVEDYAKSISTFVYLIEDLELLKDVEAVTGDKSKTDLRQEAIQYIAACFAEYGGPYKAGDFLSKRRDTKYATQVLVHLAKIFQERNFYSDAIETLTILLDFYPLSPDAADYQKQIVDSYEMAGDKDSAERERAKLVEKYSPGSLWFDTNTDETIRAQAATVAEEYLYRLGSEAQLRAQTGQDSLEYQQAIGWYEFYLQKFPEGERANKVQFYLGESYYDVGNFESAVAAYHELAVGYPQSEFGETAAYHRVLAYDRLTQQASQTDSSDFFLFNFLAKGDSAVDIVAARSDAQANLLQASNDFYIFYPFSPWAQGVLMNFGQMLYDIKRYDLAQEVYQEVMNKPEANPYLVQAYFMSGQCHYKTDDFDGAEQTFTQLTKLFPDSSKYVDPANKLIASARFQKAEFYLTNGDTLMAAMAFEDVTNTAPDSTIAERALLEAANHFEHLGAKAKAAGLFEQMTTRFPASKLLGQSLFKSANLWEEIEEWERAASDYLQLYHRDPQAALAPEALMAAARCKETLEQYDLARQLYGEYAKVYVADIDRLLEASFKRAEIAYNQQDLDTAQKEFVALISSYNRFAGKGMSPDPYLVANAQFLLAEISLQHFQDIKLTPPVARKLKRKRTVFQKVVKAYTAAAKYKVAEWTTAASFKIGTAFEEFGQALLDSPRPANLSPEALDQYNKKLWESVIPFKEKAQETYEANIRNAAENSIENIWVLESQKRLDALRNELDLGAVQRKQTYDSFGVSK